MKKGLVILLALVLALTMLPATAMADSVIEIKTVAQLEAAINGQADGQTWSIAAGTYDLPNMFTANGQTGWYFPITKNHITIIGAGMDKTVITSSTYTHNNDSTPHTAFLAIIGDNVTVQDLTLRPKVDANKAIDVLGKSSTIKNVAVRGNTLIDHKSYLSQKGVAENSNGDLWQAYTQTCPGMLFYEPRDRDLGISILDNFYLMQSQLSCYKTEVLTGTLTISGSTIDYRGSGNAPYPECGPMIATTDLITKLAGGGLTLIFDDTMGDIQSQVFLGEPTGTVVNLTPGTYGGFTIPAGITVNVPDGVVLSGDIVNNGTLNIASGAIVKGTITGNPTVKTLDQTVIDASVNPTYTIVIPTGVSFGMLEKSWPEQGMPFSVAIKDALLDNGATVNVAVDSEFKMKDQASGSTANLPFQLYNTTTYSVITDITKALKSNANYCTFTSDKATDQVDGYVTCWPSALTNAGTYSGTMDFTISYVAK